MPDFLPYFERAAKGARTGLFAAVDNLAFVLNGFCRTPAMDYTDLTEASDPDFEPAYGSFCYGTVPLLDLSTPPSSAAVPPAVAEGPSGGDLAPPLSPGATNPTGHPTLDRIVTDITELMTGERRLQIEAKDAIPDRWHGGRASAFREVLEMFANASKK